MSRQQNQVNGSYQVRMAKKNKQYMIRMIQYTNELLIRVVIIIAILLRGLVLVSTFTTTFRFARGENALNSYSQRVSNKEIKAILNIALTFQ